MASPQGRAADRSCDQRHIDRSRAFRLFCQSEGSHHRVGGATVEGRRGLKPGGAMIPRLVMAWAALADEILGTHNAKAPR